MPNDRPTDRPSTAPRGETLAAFPRRGPNGVEQELRIVLDEFEEHPYIGLRVWLKNFEGRWIPKAGGGCSVRLGEARGTIEALRRALETVESRRGDDRRPRRDDRPQRPASQPATAVAGSDDDDFAY